jgi:hypothetical protein
MFGPFGVHLSTRRAEKKANVRPEFDQCPPLALLLFVLDRLMQGQPSGSAKFGFPSLRQPQFFDSTSIRGSQRGHVLVRLVLFSFCLLARARQETSLCFQYNFFSIPDIPARAGAEVGHVASCPARFAGPLQSGIYGPVRGRVVGGRVDR